MNKKLIEQLYNSRLLRTREELEEFEESLKEISKEIQENDIPELCKVFDDQTENEEVMFGLIHLIEQFQGSNYMKYIVISSPEMIKAHEWAMTLNKGIINSSKYFDEYINIINSLDSLHKDKIHHLLIDIKKDNPKKFEEKVKLILERTRYH